MAGDQPTTFYFGAYAVCVQDDRILLARLAPVVTTHAGHWTLPGGGVEFGESPDDAVLRELFEETGLRGRRQGVLGVFSHVYPGPTEAPRPPVHVIGVLYDVDAEPGELVHEIGGSTDQCAWVPLKAASQLELVEIAAYALDLVSSKSYR